MQQWRAQEPRFTFVYMRYNSFREENKIWTLEFIHKQRTKITQTCTFTVNMWWKYTEYVSGVERDSEAKEHESDAAEGYRSAQLHRATAQRINAEAVKYLIFAQNNPTYRHYAGNDGQRVGISGERSLKWDEKPVECLEWTFFGRERQRRRARYSLEHPCGGCLCIYMKSKIA